MDLGLEKKGVKSLEHLGVENTKSLGRWEQILVILRVQK